MSHRFVNSTSYAPNPPKKGGHIDFLCGWGAGCIETCMLFPSYKIIFRQQLHGYIMVEAIKQIRSEGLRLLYRGLLPPLMMRTTSRAVMFGMYDQFQTKLGCPHSPPNSSFSFCHAQAAFLAGMCEATLCPLERVQVLLQTSAHNKEFKNTAHALTAVRKFGFREYYRGLSVILVRNGLSNALFFTLRDPFKRKIVENHPMAAKHPGAVVVFADFLSGGLLGAVISTFFFPLNLVKNHMQSKINTKFENPFAVFSEVWKERNGSIRQMYLGVHLNFTRSLVAWGITNSMYEALRRLLKRFDE